MAAEIQRKLLSVVPSPIARRTGRARPVRGPAVTVPAAELAVDPAAPLAEELARIHRGRLAKALDALTEGSAEDIGRGVHAARKEIKKARSTLRLLRPALADNVRRAQNDRLRRAGRILGPIRDADAKRQTLLSLVERDPALAGPGTDAWRRELAAERSREQGNPSPIADAESLLHESVGNAGGWHPEATDGEILSAGLGRAYRRGAAAYREIAGESGPDAEVVHDLRKRVKDLWYMLDALAPLWPAPLAATAAEAHRLSSDLGDHHDLAVLVADGRARRVALPAAYLDLLAAAAARRQEDLWRAAVPLADRLYAEKPKAFRRRMRAYREASSSLGRT